MEVIWRNIPDFPDYKVSNLGGIISYRRYSNGQLLHGCPDKDGYL